MDHNPSLRGKKNQNSPLINNNNYLTFLLGDNLKNIKINYNIKGNDSFNSILSNKRFVLNKNSPNNFNNYMNKFDKFKPDTPSKNKTFKLGHNIGLSNKIRNDLRRTKDSFFRKKENSNIYKKEEEKKLNRNKSAKNIKSSDLNLFNKDYKININQNNNQIYINYYMKNINNANKYPINNKFINNYNQNLNQFINYENFTKQIKYSQSPEMSQAYSRNRQKPLFLSLNPLYKVSKRKAGSVSNNNNNFYLKKKNLKFKSNSINSERINLNKDQKILELKTPMNKRSILKGFKTPIYKIRKNLLKTNDLSLTKKMKLSSVSTRDNMKQNKGNSEISITFNEKDNKEDKHVPVVKKEIEEYIKGYNAITQAGNDKNFLRKINQDYYFIEMNINKIKNYNIFGVLDGHGLYGHLISLFVGKYIVKSFINHNELNASSDLEELYFKLKHNNYKIINEIFVNAEKELYNEEFDSNFSGTTCIIVIQLGEKLICANSGDSRAILVYNQKDSLLDKKAKESDTNFYQIRNIIAPYSTYRNNICASLKSSPSRSSLDLKKLKLLDQRTSLSKKSIHFDNFATNIFNLSNDLKPTLPLEKQRIIENGGRVEKYIEEDGTSNGPYRVWVQDEMYPGLAMSRSIGDFIASSVGVIPNPEIIEYSLNKSSEYMIIASDGIWQFMSNEKVMSIANKFYPKKDPIDLCNELVREAEICWDKEGLPRDDITVLVVYF